MVLTFAHWDVMWVGGICFCAGLVAGWLLDLAFDDG